MCSLFNYSTVLKIINKNTLHMFIYFIKNVLKYKNPETKFLFPNLFLLFTDGSSKIMIIFTLREFQRFNLDLRIQKYSALVPVLMNVPLTIAVTILKIIRVNRIKVSTLYMNLKLYLKVRCKNI